MTKYYLILILLLSSQTSMACGTVNMRFKHYDNITDTHKREQYLAKNWCHLEINYFPHKDDHLVFSALLDAIKNQFDRELINKHLKMYRCVYSQRNKSDYAIIRNFIGHDAFDSFCDVGKLKSSYIIKAKSGVNLRSKPDASGKKIDTIRGGVYVYGINRQGEWIYAETYSGKGYIHSSLLIQY